MKNEDKTIEQGEVEIKVNRFSNIGGLLKNAGKSIINTGKRFKEWTKDELEKFQENLDFKKEFNKETHEFRIDGTNETFRGFKNTEDSNIYYKIQDDKITKFVKSDSILVRTSDNFKLQVISVENKKVINGSLVVNGEQVPIALFTIVTKVYEKEKVSTIVNHVTQNLSISDSTINGNIQQINDLTNKLNDFEANLYSFKPAFLSKNTYNEAIKIYGSVKESIITGQKESPIVTKFMDLLTKLGGPLLSIFTTIIK